MKKKSLIGIIAGVVIVPIAACLIIMNLKGAGVGDESAKRALTDIEGETVASLDEEAIALAASSDTDAGLRNMALDALDEVNAERSAYGLSTLTWNGNLEAAASVRAQECEASFSHTRPNGKPWYTVNSRVQGGENLAYGFSNANSTVGAWMDSPTHRENILWGDFRTCAIAVYVADDGTYYWAQEFGYGR
ncbi:MAG: CAP domain-containing protein [Lachnospiraceae bacterium]|nr:CAP domain-containing protein [Lachnospiraceae bacterium]